MGHRWSLDRLDSQHHRATNNRQGLIADLIVGIVVAFVGGYFLSPLFIVGTINEATSASRPAVSLGGADIVLAVSKLFFNKAVS